MKNTLLALNAGSSSIKFSVYNTSAEPCELAGGQVENIGSSARISYCVPGEQDVVQEIGAADHARALDAILNCLKHVIGDCRIVAVGHRVAHGGVAFTSPTVLDEITMGRLRALEPLAPLHQPHNLNCIEAARTAFPEAIQIACFDTAFHRGHPWVNDTFALPRKYYDQGVRRYGFHGLSYDYVTSEIARSFPELSSGKVVIAHLGNGASMCAVQNGSSVASSMGFSALDGLPMGTRCGQLDPGVLLYLMDREQMSVEQITKLLYRESGLKGLSGLTHDMRILEASDTIEAEEAIDYFVFRIRREIGAMVAVLDGLDTLIFCGGIGENSARIRAQICKGMDWIGIDLDAHFNAANATTISTNRTRVMVIPTDEERVIARAMVSALAGSGTHRTA